MGDGANQTGETKGLSVWLRVGWVGAAPTQVLGMTPTLLMFGWLYWDGLAPTLNLCLVGGTGI